MSTRLGGRYQLVRELGAGGMGRVFQAVDTETGRPVAAKIMIASSDDNLEALLRFQQEGAVLSTLKHPNIVEVYGTFLEEHTSCIIMELLEGRSLQQILKSERLPLPRIQHLAQQVASALAYAHGRAIVHRDVKPDNIMIVGNDHVKVTDFGIARILRTGSTLNTATGMSIGTPLYMAPEQIEGQKVDGRADIYSFGAVMYQMVTGRPPFDGDDPLTVAFKHVHKAPQPPSEVNADVPSDWEALILKTLSKDPGDRFQTAQALLEAVSSLGSEAGEAAGRQTTGDPARDNGGSNTRPVDTVDRIIHPEITPNPQNRPAASTAPPQNLGTDGQTRLRPVQPSPADIPASTVIRPVDPVGGQPGVRRTDGAGSTVLGSMTGADAVGQTRIGVRPDDAARRTPPPLKPEVVTVRKEEEPKRGMPLVPILGGLGAAVVILGGAGAFFLTRGSPSKPITPTAIPVANTVSLVTSGTGHAASGNTVKLAWAPVSNADIYRLQVATSATDPSDAVVFKKTKISKNVDSTSYHLKVIGAQYYYWRVRVKVNGKWNPFSKSQHFFVPQPAIGKPVPLRPTNGAKRAVKSMQLCWSGVNGAVGYMLRVDGRTQAVNSACAWVAVHAGSYSWRVAARERGVSVYTGAFSNAAHFTVTKHKKPVAPAPTAVRVQTAAPVQTVAPVPTAVRVSTPVPVATVYRAPTPVPVATYVPAPAPQPTRAKSGCNGESC